MKTVKPDPFELTRRAEEAARLLDSALLNEAFETIERDAYEALLRTSRADGDELIHRINAIRALKDQLRLVVTKAQQGVRKPPAVA